MLDFPLISLILLILAMLIVISVILSLVAESVSPTTPPAHFNEYLARREMARQRRSHKVRTDWLITAIVCCVLAVVFALL